MRTETRSLVIASVLFGLVLWTTDSAAKPKKSRPDAAVPSVPTDSSEAPPSPPEMLTLSVEVTLPSTQPPSPQPSALDSCPALRKALATLSVHFAIGSATITGAAIQEVAAISDQIKASGVGAGADFSVEGHCEPVGSEDNDRALSEERAKAVLERLVELGAIGASQAKTVGWGKQRPVDRGSNSDARAKNRRVEIRVFCPVL